MLKHISICAALVFLGTGAVNAQQQQASLEHVELPGTGLDIVLAIPKSPASTINLAMSPDALVMNLIGGQLALAFNSETDALQTWASLQRPGCAFQVQRKNDTAQTPIAVYVIPNHTAPAAIRTASLIAPQPDPIMHKVELPGRAFDIVFAMTKTPVADINDRLDSLAVYSAGSELVMATDGDLERMFKEVGLSQLPICAFEVEYKGGKQPRTASVYIVPK